ncbi:putative inner membrane protein (DUF1819) [Fusobacterium gonidiaformans 3-1-5R]|uniref:Putative inner membrane protein (DUF1819) n=2 Tax=Fusobacterium TaxID=848 RepID=E5BFA3_9FUSO|nr:putative inner membrane protein (DUF1819) [Fusobacterium gonidiaformans 3-1-5R]
MLMKYRAITGENFYVQELKNACQFLLQHPEVENRKQAFQELDILNCISESNFNKKFQAIQKRLQVFTPKLMELFLKVDYSTVKFINLYAILSKERFFAEFMDEVLKEKYSLLDFELTNYDFYEFMERKREQSEIIQQWSNAGCNKMIHKLKNFLIEANFLEKSLSGELYLIKRPLVDMAVIEEIEKHGNVKILRLMLY